MALYIFCYLSIFFLAAATAFADFQQDINQALQCVSDHSKIFPQIAQCYEEHDENAAAENDYEAVIKKVCRMKVPKACLVKTTEVLRQDCFKATLGKLFDRVLTLINVAYNHACYEDGKRIIEFIKNDGVNCVQQVFTDPDNKVESCIRTQFNAKDDLLASRQTAEKFQELRCNLVYQMKGCFIDGMTSCSKPRKILDDLYNELAKEVDCSPGSSARIQAPDLLVLISVCLLMLFCHP